MHANGHHRGKGLLWKQRNHPGRTRFQEWQHIALVGHGGPQRISSMSHDIVAVAVLGCWFYLIAARGAFWLSSVLPTLRFYRMPLLWAAALPAVSLIYLAFTIDSAFQHARRGGGMWKGRVPVRSAR
jgi:hypothetical protein